MSITSIPDFDFSGQKVLSPAALAHVVLRTNNMKRLNDYYVEFLGGNMVFEGKTLSFITYDDEHHRIAIIDIPGTAPKDPKSCGLEHIAFTYNTMADLMLAYRQRKVRGIEPVWCVNHGPATSIYYRDPDGNMIETQVDNFDTPEEATAFMVAMYPENPIGTDFDPEDFIKAIRDGKDQNLLKKRKEIGARELPVLEELGKKDVSLV